MLLHPLEERLSSVPRWTIVRTIQKQSVMDHSARVAIMASRIAITIYDIRDVNTLFCVQSYALWHDSEESVSGDIASPAKFAVDMEALRDKFVHELPNPAVLIDDLPIVTHIVKLADLAEALVFLLIEMSMGNSSVSLIYGDINRKLRAMDKGEQVANMVFGTFGSFEQDPLDVRDRDAE